MDRPQIPVVERPDDADRVKRSLYGSTDPAARYRAVRGFVADGRELKAGDTVAGTDLAPGTLESCVRVGHLVAAG